MCAEEGVADGERVMEVVVTATIAAWRAGKQPDEQQAGRDAGTGNWHEM